LVLRVKFAVGFGRYRPRKFADEEIKVSEQQMALTLKQADDTELPPSEWLIDDDSLDQGRDDGCLSGSASQMRS
jgi:hypothetical protein